MITQKSDDQWRELSTDKEAALRALTDWAADILTVIRMVAGPSRANRLADSSTRSVYWYTEELFTSLSQAATGGMISTDLTPAVLARWMDKANDREWVLRELADEFRRMRYVLNVVSGGNGLVWVASSGPNRPYRFAEKAHIATLTLLSGSYEDGYRLAELAVDNHESTAYNQKWLDAEKRAASVVVTVAADGHSATITTPNGGEHVAGRVADGGLFWVGGDQYVGEKDRVIGYHGSWEAIGRIVANHHLYQIDTPVIVDYPGTDTAQASPPADPSGQTDRPDGYTQRLAYERGSGHEGWLRPGSDGTVTITLDGNPLVGIDLAEGTVLAWPDGEQAQVVYRFPAIER